MVGARERLLARCLDGDPDAVAALAELPAAGRLLVEHGLAPALALGPLGDRPPLATLADLRREVRSAATRHLLLGRALAGVAADLGDVGIAWAPLKGLDLGGRVYDRPEERPTGDLDLLIAAADLPAARQALEGAGWRGRSVGPRYEAYLAGEAYNWQALDRRGLLLEVHYRLWGMVPAELAADLLRRARPDPALGPTARRALLADAYLVAAVHAWITPPPRPLLYWWDLERIARAGGPSLAAEVTALAAGYGLDLPVGLAAAVAAELWPETAGRTAVNNEIAAGLLAALPAPERVALAVARWRGATATPLGMLVLARLVARRPSRSGWRSLGRRLWAHPGAVEEETPAHWRWPARRLVHLAGGLHCDKINRLLHDHFDRAYRSRPTPP